MSQTIKHQGFFIANSEGEYLWASPEIGVLFGYGPEALLGNLWQKHLHPDDLPRIAAEWRRCRKAAIPFSSRYRMSCSEGGWKEVIGRAEARTEAGGGFLYYVGSLAEAEVDLEEAVQRQSQQAKSNFLSTVNHELRTPLNGILGMVELLLETRLDDGQRDFARTIQSSAGLLLGHINRILDYTKADAGEIEFEPIEFELRPLVAALQEAYLEPFAAKGLELRSCVDKDVPKRIFGDPGRLRQVMDVLLDNALRFTESGHVEIHLASAGVTEQNWSRVEFRVEDTGRGLEPGQAERMVEAFTQGEPTMTRTIGGLGLGLALARRLLNMMESSLRITSSPKMGSCFAFILESPPLRDAGPVESISLTGRSVLIVDAHDVDRRVTGEHFLAAGCKVFEAVTYAEAMELLRGESLGAVDLVVVDADLQDDGPEEFGRHLAETFPHRAGAWMALNSLGRKGDAHRLQCAGYHGFLVKPAEGEVLLAVASRVMAREPGTSTDMVTRYSLKEGQAEEEQGESKRGTRVLIVDDNAINQKVLMLFLQQNGCCVDAASDGKEAVALAIDHDYDIIFMDCRMPGMDGIAAAEAIRNHEKTTGKPATPIIGLTARALSHSYRECVEAGMNGYLTKPFKREILWQELLRWTKDHE